METKKTLMAAALGISATLIAGTALAGDKYPPPKDDLICHNIGGPRDLGANCEATGFCTFYVVGDNGQLSTISVTENQFFGIVIGASETAAAAHIAHGDGFVDALFDPPLHLASVVGPHQSSNVECLATRVLPQPEEPGN